MLVETVTGKVKFLQFFGKIKINDLLIGCKRYGICTDCPFRVVRIGKRI